jgi:4Fe-4S ferredoxin
VSPRDTTQLSNEDCGDPGRLQPVIDRNRCEGKSDCKRVCPYDVFDVVVLDRDQRRAITGLGRLKALFHGYKQAVTVRADQCHGCGLCVKVCPEKAIRLAKVASKL